MLAVGTLKAAQNRCRASARDGGRTCAHLAYDYPLLGAVWSMPVFFLWIMWFVLLFRLQGGAPRPVHRRPGHPPAADEPAVGRHKGALPHAPFRSDHLVEPRLALSEPDWIRERPGGDVLEEVVWMPSVTFWQVTPGLPFSTGVPDGHGHTYAAAYAEGWNTVMRPAGFTAQDLHLLKDITDRTEPTATGFCCPAVSAAETRRGSRVR